MRENSILDQVQSQEITLSDILGDSISKEDALAIIKSNQKAWQLFTDFPDEEQEKLITFIQGGRGLPILYGNFFKYIMDPETHPHRLEQFLSAILNQKIHIRSILPRDGIKLSEQGSLVIMDIVAELKDGSIIDVEMQKVGYQFSGERSSCYASDLVMRQYNRIKSKRKKEFSFKDMKPVYLIILMEHSAKEFLTVAPKYLHRGIHSFDSGAKINLLTNILYISLDTFHAAVHNISNLSDAWLTFLSSDNPEDILKLVKAYPEFIECYHDIAEFRRNPEELMTMHTDAFRIAEENTVKYMCEEQQKEIAELRRSGEEKDKINAAQQKELEEKNKINRTQQNQIVVQQNQINEQQSQIREQQSQIDELRKQLEALQAVITSAT